MKEFNDYDRKYPNLVMDILDYFKIESGIDNKSVLKFCTMHGKKDGGGVDFVYQPEIVSRICQKLCKKNKLSALRTGSGLGFDDNYVFIIRNKQEWERNYNKLRHYYNSLVYGFEYIYYFYKELVIPLVWEKGNGDYSAGTGFKFCGGIVTARHCIEDPKHLSIKGFSAAELRESQILVPNNPNLDIAFIDVGRSDDLEVFIDDGTILQDVLVMGYPKIPAFTDFLTAEKGTISSKAESRLTPTKGTVAAFGDNYLSGAELMLITARIRGGNSGGPVINEDGSIIGIACQTPYYDDEIGDYDDLGYGIAVPIKYLQEVLRGKNQTTRKNEDFFRDNTLYGE